MTRSPGFLEGGSMRGGALPAVIREPARAKINLTLHVLGKRPDGYHELESLAVFANICDELSFRPDQATRLSLEGPFAGAVDGENLVLKAARAVSGWLGRELHGDFKLVKNIPVAAGLGGGSSDAAAAIRILLKAHAYPGEPVDFIERSAAIGADVPVCLYHRQAWMRGLGERITPAANLAPLPAILVNPGVKLSTAAVFKKLGAAPLRPGAGVSGSFLDCRLGSPDEAASWLAQGRNDLETPAAALEPAVGITLATIRRQEGCLLARLSGSGPTCFGLFPSAESAATAAGEIAKTDPSWWVVAAVLS